MIMEKWLHLECKFWAFCKCLFSRFCSCLESKLGAFLWITRLCQQLSIHCHWLQKAATAEIPKYSFINREKVTLSLLDHMLRVETSKQTIKQNKNSKENSLFVIWSYNNSISIFKSIYSEIPLKIHQMPVSF